MARGAQGSRPIAVWSIPRCFLTEAKRFALGPQYEYFARALPAIWIWRVASQQAIARVAVDVVARASGTRSPCWPRSRIARR